MPYKALQKLVPPLALSGTPVRMMVMVTLAAAVLTSVAFVLLFRGPPRVRLGACALLGLLILEYLPQQLASTRPFVPGYVTALRDIRGPEACSTW
jgi:hypothetical protein